MGLVVCLGYGFYNDAAPMALKTDSGPIKLRWSDIFVATAGLEFPSSGRSERHVVAEIGI
jgi:hypothetical protein